MSAAHGYKFETNSLNGIVSIHTFEHELYHDHQICLCLTNELHPCVGTQLAFSCPEVIPV